MKMNIAELTCNFALEVAHFQPHCPEGHPNRRIHGHSYHGKLTLRGPVNADDGMLMDFEVLRTKVAKMVEELDHRCLNDVQGLERPSSERLAIWIWDRMKPEIPALHRVELARPTVGMSVCYEGPQLL
jgi:6-pyruvoyltetrahydropterin/6-carboxytetrahydropterin synthase